MKRTNDEIQNAIDLFKSKDENNNNIAILDVLENDLDEEQIESTYHDETNVWVEQSALNARMWLDGELELDDVY